MTREQIIILVVFIAYIIAMVVVGTCFCKKNTNNAEYTLGGRKLNPWVSAMSAQASDMSGWLLQGLPGKACTIIALAGGVGFITGSCKSAIMIAVGLYSRKHATNVNDFVLGGRSVGPWLTAFAYGTSYFSAVVFVGYAGQFGYKYGLASTWIGIGNAIIGSLLAWVIL